MLVLYITYRAFSCTQQEEEEKIQLLHFCGSGSLHFLLTHKQDRTCSKGQSSQVDQLCPEQCEENSPHGVILEEFQEEMKT